MEKQRPLKWLPRSSKRLRQLAVALLLAGITSCGDAGPTLTVVAFKKEVVADDGFVLEAFDLHLKGQGQDEVPRAWMFYLVGSEPVSVVQSMAQYAELIARGLVVVLLQPRGVSGDGTVDQSLFRQHETRQRRVADQVAVLDAYLDDSPNIPVLLVGTSQGGVVAADVAATDPRVTHLLMMASGGGWTQAEDLTHFVENGQGPPSVTSVEALKGKFQEIQANPDSGELWLGHPFRMWSSYLWFRPLDGLLELTIPMLLAQGSADLATPVGSARALRDAFSAEGRTNLTYLEYPGLDHHFCDETGANRLIDLQEDAYTWMSQTGLMAQ